MWGLRNGPPSVKETIGSFVSGGVQRILSEETKALVQSLAISVYAGFLQAVIRY